VAVSRNQEVINPDSGKMAKCEPEAKQKEDGRKPELPGKPLGGNSEEKYEGKEYEGRRAWD